MGAESDRKHLRQLCEAFVTQALCLPEWGDYGSVKGLPEFQAVYAFAEREGLISKIGVSKSDAEGKALQADATDLWQFYLLPLLERSSRGDLEYVCEQCVDSLYADRATWQVVAPLPRFTAQGGRVELPNGVIIRELEAGEKQYLDEFQRSIRFGEAIELGLLDVSFAMSCRKESPKAGPMQGELGDDDFEPVVTALRLLKGGAVWYNLQVQCPEHPPFGTQFPVGQRGGGWSSKPKVYGSEYELLEADVEPLSGLVRRLGNIAQHKQMPLALRRFNMAYERGAAEDRLIDCWVGLEALFSPSDRGELSYRIALRAAYFIASPPEEREQIFTALRDHYGTRSDVVHGRKPKRDVKVAAEAVEGYLRRALRKIVSDPTSFRPDELDLVVARGQFQQGAR